MIKLINYEFRKIIGTKWLWLFTIILLLINGIITVFYANKQNSAEIIPPGDASEFLELYLENTTAMDEYYDSITDYQLKQEKLFVEAMRAHEDYIETPWVDQYSKGDYSDSTLFKITRQQMLLDETRKSDIQDVINSAKVNLYEYDYMGISHDSYTYKYQLNVIEKYSNIHDKIQIDVEYTHGWEAYFTYDIVNIFIFTSIIMLCAFVFVQEKQNGCLYLIRATKDGRIKTAFAKISAAMLTGTMCILIFTLTTWALIGIICGYSSSANAIQALDKFALCPYVINIGEYFVINLAVKLLTFIVFALTILCVSVFIYNYIAICTTGIGLLGLNFLFYTTNYLNANAPLKNLNLISTAAVYPLFVRYRSINLFSNIVDYIPLTIILFIVLTILFVFITILKFSQSIGKQSFKIIENLKILKQKFSFHFKYKPNKKKHIKNRSYPRSILFYEIFKTLFSSRMIFVILILLCVKIYFTADNLIPTKSFGDSLYKEYMSTLYGELTPEKSTYIDEEREYITQILDKEKAMYSDYANDKITRDEYKSYVEEYRYAYSRDEFFETIELHEQYIIQTEQETGIKAYFVYDTGWEKLFSENMDIWLYATILIIFTGLFANEHSYGSSKGKISQIIKTTKYGRQKTFFAKVGTTAIVSTILATIFNAMPLMIVFKYYDMPGFGDWESIPLQSIELFANYSGNMTINNYLILMLGLRVLSTVIFALIVCGLSEIIKKHIPIMSVACSLTLMPKILITLGIEALVIIDFTEFLSATPLFLRSSISINDLAVLSITVTAWIILCIAINFVAERKYIK